MSEQDRTAILRALTPREAERLLYDWRFWARPDQIYEPGPETFTLYCAGRGWGKTRTGAEATRTVAEHHAEECGGEIGLVGRTAGDVRETMLEGPSGLLSICPPWFRPRWEPSKRRVTFPNGVVAHTFSADKPEQLRGPNLGFAWADEVAHWQNAREAWDMLALTLRHGTRPRAIATTTPTPVPVIRDLVDSEDCRVVYGSTFDNAANLAPSFVSTIVARFEGTRLGAQELHGRILDDNPNALWERSFFQYVQPDEVPTLDRVLVGVDPGGPERENDETGIVVLGLAGDGSLYVLEDRSDNYTGEAWIKEAVRLAHKWGADGIVAEVTSGGYDLTRLSVQNVDRRIPVLEVRATRSKASRARPVALLWEQGRAFHVGHPRDWLTLTDQLCAFDPALGRRQKSPDRMDALVWAGLALLADAPNVARFRALGDRSILERVRLRLGG